MTVEERQARAVAQMMRCAYAGVAIGFAALLTAWGYAASPRDIWLWW